MKSVCVCVYIYIYITCTMYNRLLCYSMLSYIKAIQDCLAFNPYLPIVPTTPLKPYFLRPTPRRLHSFRLWFGVGPEEALAPKTVQPQLRRLEPAPDRQGTQPEY